MRIFPVLILSSALLVSSAGWSQAILIEEGRKPSPITQDDGYQDATESAPAKGNLRLYSNNRDYLSLSELKSHRRMGIGAELMGRLGMVGISFDFNFTGSDAATLGMGAGPQYYSYSLGYKRTLADANLSPYLGLSMTSLRASEQNQPRDTVPGWANESFRRVSGQDSMSRVLLSPQLGLQYTQFYGPSAGATMFMEIVFILDYERRKTLPTAAFGMMYYL